MSSDILIVDDTPANLNLLGNILKEHNYKIRAVPNGELAIISTKKKSPDLILLDITMPGMNGFEVCQKIKSDETLQDIPIIFISALSDTDDKLEGFKNGGVDYITKPFQVEEVIARVNTHLKIRELIKENQTQLKQINADFEKLKKLEELRDGLVHMIIHDLRSPLFGISAYLELLTEKFNTSKDTETKKFLSIAFQSTKMLGNMINDVLDVNKLENNKIELQKSNYCLNTIVSEVISQLEAMITQKNLVVKFNSKDFNVICDQNLIKRVVANLLSNAIKFSSNNKNIIINIKQKSQNTYLEVIDEGPGISKENTSKVFNKFYQINDSIKKDTPSTGLGLTFCKLVIEAHNGKIAVESDIGKGCKFWFFLPT